MVSFGGAMFDPVHAATWAGSLMWSLLATLILIPGFVLAVFSLDENTNIATTGDTRDTVQQVSTEASAKKDQISKSVEQQFVSKERSTTLWPQSEESQSNLRESDSGTRRGALSETK